MFLFRFAASIAFLVFPVLAGGNSYLNSCLCKSEYVLLFAEITFIAVVRASRLSICCIVIVCLFRNRRPVLKYYFLLPKVFTDEASYLKFRAE